MACLKLFACFIMFIHKFVTNEDRVAVCFLQLPSTLKWQHLPILIVLSYEKGYIVSPPFFLFNPPSHQYHSSLVPAASIQSKCPPSLQPIIQRHAAAHSTPATIHALTLNTPIHWHKCTVMVQIIATTHINTQSFYHCSLAASPWLVQFAINKTHFGIWWP